jgi:protoheme ferro-lyase
MDRREFHELEHPLKHRLLPHRQQMATAQHLLAITSHSLPKQIKKPPPYQLRVAHLLQLIEADLARVNPSHSQTIKLINKV